MEPTDEPTPPSGTPRPVPQPPAQQQPAPPAGPQQPVQQQLAPPVGPQPPVYQSMPGMRPVGQPQPYQPQPASAPPPSNQPSWAAYARPIRDINDGHNAFLSERDWEGQLAATTRGPMSWGFLAFFLGLAVFYLLGLVLTPLFNSAFTDFDSGSASHSDGPLLIVEFIPNLAFAAFPLIFSWWKGGGPNRDFGLKIRLRDLRVGLACGAISFGLGLVINLLLQRFVYAGQSQPNTLHSLTELSNGRTIWLAVFALFTWVGAPITEELLFRGALWGALETFKIHRYAILALVTLVFAYGHQEPQQTLALFCQGLAIGCARMITGRISASMVAHATNNMIPALGLFFLG